MKKLLILCLLLFMIVGCSSNGTDESCFTSGSGIILGYDELKPGTCPEDVVVAEKLNGYDVVEIAELAFTGKDFTSVIFPNSIIEIDPYAFMNNNLVSVEFGDNVKEIGIQAFEYNRLESVSVPKNLELISGEGYYDKIPCDPDIPIPFGETNNDCFEYDYESYHKGTDDIFDNDVKIFKK